MKVVAIKSIVAAFTGLAGAITSAYYGYVNMSVIAGFGSFLLVLAIQYSSIKIKVATSLAALLGIFSFFYTSGQ
jgi:hypothetical protein